MAFVRALVKYQNTLTVEGALGLCFVVPKIAFLSKENNVAEGLVSGGTLVALLDVQADAPAGLT
jgi:hypothetical protein